MREEILQLHEMGLTQTEIANKLGISRAKVVYHTDDKAKAAVFAKTALQRVKEKRERGKAKALRVAAKSAGAKPKKVYKPRKEKEPEKLKKDTKPKQSREKIFKTKPIDNTGKVLVRLNHRTEVFTRPGYDINELRAKYRITV